MPVSDRRWPEAYVDGYRRAGGMLMGVRRRGERITACLKVLLHAAQSLGARAPTSISAPSAEHSVALAEIAGTASAVRAVADQGRVNLEWTADASWLAAMAKRSFPWAGSLAPRLMAASDGDLGPLLFEAAVPKLQAAAQAGPPDPAWLVQPAFRIDHAAVFLAELNAAAQGRPDAVHEARAERLNQRMSSTYPEESARVSAHAFAIHYLTGIYGHGTGVTAVRETMLRFIAAHPPEERAALRASRVAALLSDAFGARAEMALLDFILLLLGPKQTGNPSVQLELARDSALVLLLLDTDADQLYEPATVAVPVPQRRSAPSSPQTGRGQHPFAPADNEVTGAAGIDSSDAIAEIAREAERAIATAVAERRARYQQAVDADSLTDALVVVRDAAAGDDHEQVWRLLQDIARRYPDANPADLVTVAPNVLGGVALDGDEHFDGPGAGCFTALSSAPLDAAAAIARITGRLMNVDDKGIEHADSATARDSGAYTPNTIHEITTSDFGAQVSLDTKGWMPAPMARTMLAVITQSLIDDRVPALITGWIPALDPEMTPWNPQD
jgi:hypothetical protein